MNNYIQELNEFSELMVKLIGPTVDEAQELRRCIDDFGADIFNHLDRINLPLEQLEKLDAIRILISGRKEDNQ
ncbi:hypothetical protein Desde_3192 [Desulfitobacterium dehalogenans ATCC 51507]|uniref:Uncharacterized protein n=1 Tax=Desulfitobacterium dehalogenans (strain ATCC 51507 / DSM 9161 / JW/IU-DC1) TaxID=756499 RepID=I4ABZ8_DESDJ|nr:hypothetical protein [Desulfitobacterium dehalogenans]AFM01483.1 hypothetical protein Desde_3192 [Desulfitobacterium dehalogenans ATCC 51507]